MYIHFTFCQKESLSWKIVVGHLKIGTTDSLWDFLKRLFLWTKRGPLCVIGPTWDVDLSTSDFFLFSVTDQTFVPVETLKQK